MDTETSEAIDTLRADMSRMGERLEIAIRDGLATNRRHSDVIAESLRDDIRMVAEGVISIDTRVTTMDARLGSVEGKVDQLDIKVNQLDAKVDRLDAKVDVLDAKAAALDTKVGALDAKVDALKPPNEPR